MHHYLEHCPGSSQAYNRGQASTVPIAADPAVTIAGVPLDHDYNSGWTLMSDSDSPQTDAQQNASSTRWWDIGGWSRLLAAFRLGAEPGRILLALGALAFSYVLSAVLDFIWVRSGADPVFPQIASAPFAGLAGCAVVGVWEWAKVLAAHPAYAVIFLGLSLIVWGYLCGAICRSMAIEYGRSIRIDLAEALRYAREHLFTAFIRAPLLPVLFILLICLLLMVGGILLSIPWLGDLLGGLLFFVPVIMGLLATYVLLAGLVGGALFWPATATDGYTGMECVSHCIGYVQQRPIKTIWHLLVSLALISLVLWALSWFIWGGFNATHEFLGVGAGWVTERTAEIDETRVTGSKVDAVWSLDGPHEWFGPGRYDLKLHDHPLRWLVGAWVYLFWGVVWAYAVNVWLGACTIIYFHLRSDIDRFAPNRVYRGPEDLDSPDAALPGSTGTAADATAGTASGSADQHRASSGESPIA